MTTLYADFNARTRDDRVRLDTVGSRRSLRAAPQATPGSWLWVSDNEVRAGAVLEESASGLVARIAWETAEDVVQETAPNGDVASALRELQTLMQGDGRDWRKVLQVLPFAERGLPPGRADYVRSRAAEAFGYPALALAAIEDALREAPDTPGFLHQWLDLLKRIDLERALSEAKTLVARGKLPAVVIAACAGVYGAAARHAKGGEMVRLQGELLAFTEHFNDSPGFQTTPPGVAAMVYVTRGFALLHLRDRDKAVAEFDQAVRSNPASAEARAARGLETYPSAAAVADLERAVELEIPSFWPAYYLAHHRLQIRDWRGVVQLAAGALRSAPPDRVRANILEWQTIARFHLGEDPRQCREQMLEAVALAPTNEHLRRNLQILDAATGSPSQRLEWEVTRDAEKDTDDVQIAA